MGLVVGVLLGYLARSFEIGWLTDDRSPPSARSSSSLLRVVVVPLVLTAVIVVDRQPAPGDQRRQAGCADPGLVRHHRADRRDDRHRHRAASPTRRARHHRHRRRRGAQPLAVPGWTSSSRSCRPTSSASSPSDSAPVVQRPPARRDRYRPRCRRSGGRPARPRRSSTSPGACLDIFSKLVWWIIRLAPIGSAGPDRQGGRELRLGSRVARWPCSPATCTSAARSCCSSSTRCWPGRHGPAARGTTSPAPGRRSSSRSCRARRRQHCR